MEDQKMMMPEQVEQPAPPQKRPVTLWIVLLVAVIAAVILLVYQSVAPAQPVQEEEIPTAMCDML